MVVPEKCYLSESFAFVRKENDSLVYESYEEDPGTGGEIYLPQDIFLNKERELFVPDKVSITVEIH